MKHQKKGFLADPKLIKSAARFIDNEIVKKEIKSVPKEIRIFLDEAKSLEEGKEKHYSPERAVKLRGSLLSFFAIHSITSSKETKEIVNGLYAIKSAAGDASSYFSDSYEHIYRLLKNYKYREFGEAKLYFVDKEARDEIFRIDEELKSKIKTAFEKRNIKLNKIVNFLNFDGLSTFYSVKFVPKYQYISKEESIDKYLPAHYEITKNKIEKEYRERYAAHDFDKANKYILEEQKNAKLKNIDSEYEFIQKELQKDERQIDIKIISYEHSSLYPEITYNIEAEETGKDGKTKIKLSKRKQHLRSEAVNVLWYKPVQLKGSNTIAEILKNYNHAFGDVYYLVKEKE